MLNFNQKFYSKNNIQICYIKNCYKNKNLEYLQVYL